MEYLESTDMLTAFFGQDDYLAFSEQKDHASINENVLVEKFNDYDITPGHGIETGFEGSDSLFDSEWMTSKIDLTCLSEQLDNNFNLVDTGVDSSSAITASLLGDKAADVGSTKMKTSSSVESSSSEEYVFPISPEQHVPDVDGIGEQFKLLLDTYLAAVKNATPHLNHIQSLPKMIEDTTGIDEDIVDDVTKVENVTIVDEATKVGTITATKLSMKRKMLESTPPSPKIKVRTPEQKARKRQQNRTAATRYRSKKRSEQEVLNAQCSELEDENTKLRKKVENKQQEIQYLKNLIVDVFNRKPARI